MKLYVEHYSNLFRESGRPFIFAAREGVLRNYHRTIMSGLDFTRRQGLDVRLFHNIPQSLGNNKFIGEKLDKKGISLQRVSHNAEGFYDEVLRLISEISGGVEKLILLERNTLLRPDGERLNTISVARMKQRVVQGDYDFGDISRRNTNFQGTLSTICDAIMDDVINRVHILKASEKGAIKNELFSIDGSGTLLGKDFGSPDVSHADDLEVQIIYDMLCSDTSGLIKPRSKEYIISHIDNFLIARVDGYPVGCVEMKNIDEYTVELGALYVTDSFLSQRIGRALIAEFHKISDQKNKSIICMTNNTKLQSMLITMGYKKEQTLFSERQNQSPDVQMFLRQGV